VLLARVGTAAVLIAGLLAALFLLPLPLLMVLVGAVIVVAALEWGRLCKLARPSLWLYASLVAVLFIVCAWMGAALPVMAMGAAFWILVAPLWLRQGMMRPDQARLLPAAGLAVLIPAGLAMVALPPAQVLEVLGLTWVADTTAYFAGRRFGRHKLAPSISPGKTWEGAAGALVGVLVYAIICAIWLPSLSVIAGSLWLAYFAAALVLCAASIVGDLFESAAKRQAAVKDSGTFLPGHGGILDRIDSATSTLPIAAILWTLIPSQ
jgi:phosphatidate cytidylyltransferase